MLVTTLDLRFSAFCPTPENYDDYGDYLDMINVYVESLSDTIYIEKRIAMSGIDLSILNDE